MPANALLAIVGMALATYATRSGGLWLMGRVRPTPRVEAWLSHVPGAILVAIVAPGIITGGLATVGASFATVLVAARTKQLLLAMVAGVALFAFLQTILPH